ncbi:hypothetical protein JG687_00018073 [Phytophthora cactorum]|uniref:Uncharacterized protein n=1 Tax=Phytophthora cactorum TaxID=29920 RepID=A0A8T1TLE6_9STRA|nr:hypothetical protein JG687_00018073 [Phytophthora cactorum]
MVKPRGKVHRDNEVTGRDLSFKSVWRELRGQGWSSKRPPSSSLDDRYKYVRPGGHTIGTVSIDLFLVEEQAIKFYANVLRSRGCASSRSDGHVHAPALPSAPNLQALRKWFVKTTCPILNPLQLLKLRLGLLQQRLVHRIQKMIRTRLYLTKLRIHLKVA